METHDVQKQQEEREQQAHKDDTRTYVIGSNCGFLAFSRGWLTAVDSSKVSTITINLSRQSIDAILPSIFVMVSADF